MTSKTQIKVFILCIGIFLASSRLAQAQVQEILPLQVDPSFYAKVCPVPIWKEKKLAWSGIEDRRTTPELGRVGKPEGKDSVTLVAQPALAILFESEIRKVLGTCGIAWQNSAAAEVPKIAFQIDEFRAEEVKHFLTGKGVAKSRLSFLADKPNQKISANVGFQIEFKQTRKRGSKNLQKALQELLQGTLEQLVNSPQLRDL